MIKKWIRALVDWMFKELFIEMNATFRELVRLRKAIESRPVFVIISTPSGLMMGQKIFLTPGAHNRATFSPMRPLPAGLHVNIIGDAYITDVTVGNMAQLLSYPSDLPFCITRDPCEMGNTIRVGVKGMIE